MSRIFSEIVVLATADAARGVIRKCSDKGSVPRRRARHAADKAVVSSAAGGCVVCEEPPLIFRYNLYLAKLLQTIGEHKQRPQCVAPRVRPQPCQRFWRGWWATERRVTRGSGNPQQKQKPSTTQSCQGLLLTLRLRRTLTISFLSVIVKSRFPLEKLTIENLTGRRAPALEGGRGVGVYGHPQTPQHACSGCV